MKKGFTQIPNSIIKDKRVSNGEFRTLVILYSFKFGKKGKVFPSQKTVADIEGKSRVAVNRRIKRLKDLGYLGAKRRGYSTSNAYDFYTPIVKKTIHHKLKKGCTNNTKVNNTEDKKVNKKIINKGMKEVLKKNPWIKNKTRNNSRKEL